jgi:hypothetical protein
MRWLIKEGLMRGSPATEDIYQRFEKDKSLHHFSYRRATITYKLKIRASACLQEATTKQLQCFVGLHDH